MSQYVGVLPFSQQETCTCAVALRRPVLMAQLLRHCSLLIASPVARMAMRRSHQAEMHKSVPSRLAGLDF